MTKKTKIKLLTLTFIFLGVFGYLLLDSYTQNKKNYYLGVQSKLLETKYQTTYRYFKIMTHDIHEMYSHNKKLLKLLNEANKADEKKLNTIRKKIYKLLIKNYKRLNNMGISQVHFHLTNNISFLRMYKPESYGDDITQIKKSVVLTNSEKKPSEGFEACKHMLGLRFVYPLYNKEHKHIATVEISYSTQQLLRSITDDFVYDSHLLVSKSMQKGTIIEDELGYNYRETWESDKYYIEESTHKKVGDINFFDKLSTPQLRDEIAKNIETKKSFSLTRKYNYQNIILSFLPLKSATGLDNIAYIVTYTESDYLSNIEIERTYLKILFFSILILLYFFILYVIMNQAALRELALYDSLTKLPNRTLFSIELQNEINRAKRYKTKVALFFIDLDGFKGVNDTYGHQMGDKLLINVARIIRETLRNTDLVSRIGGDEFTIIISDPKNIQELEMIANKIIDALNQEMIINNKIIKIGASIGVSIYPYDANNVDELIKKADERMYISKEKGKNIVTIYDTKQ
jgi:diguanylate cyclase (GGDEF)-like protein